MEGWRRESEEERAQWEAWREGGECKDERNTGVVPSSSLSSPSPLLTLHSLPSYPLSPFIPHSSTSCRLITCVDSVILFRWRRRGETIASKLHSYIFIQWNGKCVFQPLVPLSYTDEREATPFQNLSLLIFLPLQVVRSLFFSFL